MPIRYWIEKDRRRVRAVVEGDFTTDDILDTLAAITEDPDFEAGFDVLSDHTKIGEPLTTEQARLMTSFLEGHSGLLAHARMAVVTNKPASVGMMRMLAVFLERVPLVLQTFATLEEAERWLAQPGA